MTTRVLSLSSSRADAGLLSPVWDALARQGDVDLEILLTGMHIADGGTARDMVPAGVRAHRAGADLGGAAGWDGAASAGSAMADIQAATARVIETARPDVILAIGDRLDMLPAVTASLPFNLPIVHVHGGELTEGAVDDRVRHALTKLSHLHCASCVEAAERIARMGEEPWRVQVTGAPGLDRLATAPALGPEAFAAEVGLATTAGLRLVTVHPETNAPLPLGPLDAVLAALDTTPAPALLTAPNSDPGGKEARAKIDAFVAARPWAVFRATLGTRLYANAMRHAAVMVGNSSSGLIEAPLFDLPVINVGGRQGGRPRGANVHDCAADPGRIAALMAWLEPREAGHAGTGLSPYGDGHAAPRIARLLAALPARERLLAKRFSMERPSFHAPWEHADEARRAREARQDRVVA